MPSYESGQIIEGNVQTLALSNLVKYAGASGDYNPLHFDLEYAMEKGQKSILAHGMLGAGVLSTLVTQIIEETGFVASFEVRFIKELPVNSVVTPKAEIMGIEKRSDEKRTLNVELRLENEHGETVIKGKAIIIL